MRLRGLSMLGRVGPQPAAAVCPSARCRASSVPGLGEISPLGADAKRTASTQDINPRQVAEYLGGAPLGLLVLVTAGEQQSGARLSSNQDKFGIE